MNSCFNNVGYDYSGCVQARCWDAFSYARPTGPNSCSQISSLLHLKGRIDVDPAAACDFSVNIKWKLWISLLRKQCQNAGGDSHNSNRFKAQCEIKRSSVELIRLTLHCNHKRISDTFVVNHVLTV